VVLRLLSPTRLSHSARGQVSLPLSTATHCISGVPKCERSPLLECIPSLDGMG